MTEYNNAQYHTVLGGDGSAGIPYGYPQPTGLVAVREYLFTEAEGERVVLLRWAVEADFPVDRFRFCLEQLDGAGECLGSVTVTCGGKEPDGAGRGSLLTPSDGIAVDRKCEDIRVKLLEVVSGQYVYRPRGSGADMSFEPPLPWKYDEWGGGQEGLSDRVCLRTESMKSRGVGGVGAGYRAIGALAVLLSLLLTAWMILSPYFDYLKEYEARREPSSRYTESNE